MKTFKQWFNELSIPTQRYIKKYLADAPFFSCYTEDGHVHADDKLKARLDIRVFANTNSSNALVAYLYFSDKLENDEQLTKEYRNNIFLTIQGLYKNMSLEAQKLALLFGSEQCRDEIIDNRYRVASASPVERLTLILYDCEDFDNIQTELDEDKKLDLPGPVLLELIGEEAFRTSLLDGTRSLVDYFSDVMPDDTLFFYSDFCQKVWLCSGLSHTQRKRVIHNIYTGYCNIGIYTKSQVRDLFVQFPATSLEACCDLCFNDHIKLIDTFKNCTNALSKSILTIIRMIQCCYKKTVLSFRGVNLDKDLLGLLQVYKFDIDKILPILLDKVNIKDSIAST